MLTVLILKRRYTVVGNPTVPIYTFLINGTPYGIYDTDLPRLERRIRHEAPGAAINHDWTQAPADRWKDTRPR